LLLESTQLVEETLAEFGWNFEGFAVCDQLDNVVGAVEDGSAVVAHLEVSCHARAQVGIDFRVQVPGNLAPNLDTADFNDSHLECS
jgi:hypothetical protein